MHLSYLVTCHNEGESLGLLLTKLCDTLKPNHEIIVVDDYSDCPKTLAVLESFNTKIKLYKHKLDNNYGAHKNYGIEQCTGKWIFQLDSDELPTDALVTNIDLILESNDSSEIIWLPRCNHFSGYTQQDVVDWGWRISHGGLVNFPDYQSRLFRNQPHIRYQRRLHEKVEGHKSYVFVPPQQDYAIIHNKTIEKQRESNQNYMKNFTLDENRGIPIDQI